jgi:hypothetical protein
MNFKNERTPQQSCGVCDPLPNEKLARGQPLMRSFPLALPLPNMPTIMRHDIKTFLLTKRYELADLTLGTINMLSVI